MMCMGTQIQCNTMKKPLTHSDSARQHQCHGHHTHEGTGYGTAHKLNSKQPSYEMDVPVNGSVPAVDAASTARDEYDGNLEHGASWLDPVVADTLLVLGSSMRASQGVASKAPRRFVALPSLLSSLRSVYACPCTASPVL